MVTVAERSAGCQATCYDRSPGRSRSEKSLPRKGVPQLTRDGFELDVRPDSTGSEPPIDLPLREDEPVVDAPPLRDTAAETAPAGGGGRSAIAAGMLVLGLLAGFGAGFVVGQRLAVPPPPRAVEVPRPVPIDTTPPIQMALPPPVAPAQTVPEPARAEAPVEIEEPDVEPPVPVPKPTVARPAPPAVSRPAAPAVRPATVRFDSRPPGATVYLDEVRVGVTPLTIDKVAPGEHQVRLEMLGHDTWRTSVTVKEGEQYFLGASLE
ncbi:MAG: PEGA domain-containing protein [Acidobacteria bacterium]|nr:PEGA domain-containing protein [Acidobacteriota bacterium]